MVFFTSTLIVIILYYLQADGIIYVTILALAAELINIFMTHTAKVSVEKELKAKHRRVMDGFSKRLARNRKTIQEFEKTQEDSVEILYKANIKIKKYEKELSLYRKAPDVDKPNQPLQDTPPAAPLENNPPYEHLPDGSNRGSN
jgi:hypothetical protein